MSEGWIYILRNPSHKQDLFKIGKTTLCPDKRAAELSKPTGVADKFKVVFKIDVFDCDIAEKQIHKKLDKFRNNPDREFFELPRAEAIETVTTIANKIGKASSLECEVRNKTPFGRIKSETELIEYAYSFDLELSDFLYLLYHIQMGRLWKDRGRF